MEILSQVAKSMQAILTKSADIIGGETGFIKRLRKLSGSKFVQILVFGWLNDPKSTGLKRRAACWTIPAIRKRA